MENNKQYYFLDYIDTDNFVIYYGTLKAQIPKLDIQLCLSDSLKSSCECYLIFECERLDGSKETIRCSNTALTYFETYEDFITYKQKNNKKIFFSESVVKCLTTKKI